MPTNNSSSTKRMKFSEKSISEQGYTIVNWLTNWTREQINSSKKISYADIIQDPNMFNILKNELVDISILLRNTSIKKLSNILQTKCND